RPPHPLFPYTTLFRSLDPLVLGFERVLAQDGALGVVVELQVHPVDRVVTATLGGSPDELAPQPGPRRLRRRVDRDVDLLVGAHPDRKSTRLNSSHEWI